ncbi:hypothetical protein STIAU_8255 [Stigmatella aurantiaca DW4/3-1]|uniref:Uncharacterized protein n=1 Tax=Stigmatella aurantiaca (strain DW4/3-1) TaxID=378806 RepID=Q090S3_STIAD|nr:hypothetical protein STIAU_8255 [Stigmatella aurantiaca DW4/3-1]
MPKVIYDFPLGVSEAVAKALKAIGRAKGVQLEVRGQCFLTRRWCPFPVERHTIMTRPLSDEPEGGV